MGVFSFEHAQFYERRGNVFWIRRYLHVLTKSGIVLLYYGNGRKAMFFGSVIYYLSIILLIGIAVLCWIFLRNRSFRLQKIIIITIMVLNTAQHFLKSVLYPQYFGTGFTYISTAYNMCALLIILSPVVYLFGNRFWKNFVFLVGTVAGLGAIAFPVWYLNKPLTALGWDYLRFYICHSLLFLSSLLPLLWGHYKIKRQEFWQIGLGFLLALCMILLNNVVSIVIGLHPGVSAQNLYQSLLHDNPCMLMGPKEGFEWLLAVIKPLSLPAFCGNNPTGYYAPILWYAVPLYIGITGLAYVVFTLADRKPKK